MFRWNALEWRLPPVLKFIFEDEPQSNIFWSLHTEKQAVTLSKNRLFEVVRSDVDYLLIEPIACFHRCHCDEGGLQYARI